MIHETTSSKEGVKAFTQLCFIIFIPGVEQSSEPKQKYLLIFTAGLTIAPETIFARA